MNNLESTSVAEIATRHPLSTRVFARHAVDFCCGGHEPLAEMCEARGLDLGQIVGELEAEIAPGIDDGTRWDQEPLSKLISHIIETYHKPLPAELERIEQLARKVHRVHGDKDQSVFDALLETFLAVRADIEPHLMREEEELFPSILASADPRSIIADLEDDHEALGGLLRKLRTLTGDFVVPAQACNSWRALWVGLEALEEDLHCHIHLENHILHPRAIRGDAG